MMLSQGGKDSLHGPACQPCRHELEVRAAESAAAGDREKKAQPPYCNMRSHLEAYERVRFASMLRRGVCHREQA